MNSRNYLLACAATLMMSGCVAFQTEMDTGLSHLIGSNIKWAVVNLGPPSSKQDVAGQRIYIWSTSSQGSIYMPMSSTTTGYVGGTAYSSTTTTPTLIPLTFSCTIELYTDETDKIQTYRWHGNRGGCRYWKDSLPPA